ncbi:MAG: hypothetical protein WBL27_04235 [Salinimicrobium sp.]
MAFLKPLFCYLFLLILMRYILLFLLLSTINLAAQERTPVSGTVTTEEFPLENVLIKNISSEKFTVSDVSGRFLLKMAANDTIVLSHVGMQDLIKFISQEDLQQQPLLLKMLQEPEELREVEINGHPEINAVALGIIPKEIKTLTMNERRLKTAGDFKAKSLLGLLFGSFPLDPVINAINGRTKRLKRNIGIEKQQRNIAFLEMNAMNYMKDEMQLTDAQAQQLIDYIITDERLQDVLDLENEARLQFFLQDAWYRLQNES